MILLRFLNCHLQKVFSPKNQLKSSLFLHAGLHKKTFSGICESNDTVKDQLEHYIALFRTAYIPEPESSAELITAHAMGKKMIHEVDFSTPVTKILRSRLKEMCSKRLERVPVQYILGEWDFHDLTLEMRPPVLIPRPETEELASHVLSHWDRGYHTFLDIGCGTGAISIYLLKQLPLVKAVAIDISEQACNLTQNNAVRHGVHHRLKVVHGDIMQEGTVAELCKNGPYNVIVSNPPYITTEEMKHLDTEVFKYEDHNALAGGVDGLHVINQILKIAHQLLCPGHGSLWLEVGLTQTRAIQSAIEDHPDLGLVYRNAFQDFTKRDRFAHLGVNGLRGHV
ncbi:MTRF1L release factor glutamine methyltransferase-like [Dreissena polymorpha]|uniref:peptide chain release factor N(5)-glutamine methyltransferase n=1 Tax=Dreissena polymorpha TaxID=45954 RepID=A0A9D4NFD5_DREPO|nr:MTRF1L release factor glutamine methyltransferase-like [Dreissena polymorpha]XP_052253689.1 MTRF1L release factor glutamine methyltransferase-like [Dreissena polymorpha]XP_052253699.1 MTRF1L release factor glutamine methyltransferase-like [Dreissena polymorpha]KAH3893380.1 hypothetical protein DPMN_017527 [Dreissena polymorpha]